VARRNKRKICHQFDIRNKKGKSEKEESCVRIGDKRGEYDRPQKKEKKVTKWLLEIE